MLSFPEIRDLYEDKIESQQTVTDASIYSLSVFGSGKGGTA